MTKEEQQLLQEKYLGLQSPEFEEDCKRLASGEPLAYVIGWQPFLGLKICLDSHPLIPRPETEWWTEQLISRVKGVSEENVSQRDGARGGDSPAGENAAFSEVTPLRFLDLCAGSGAIGCAALKHLPETEVYFGEIDPAHEATIQKNIAENNLDATRAHIRIGDLFEPFGDMQFDIIACNPPYIPSDRPLEPSVVDHEPSRALFAGTDGLSVMRQVARSLAQHLTHGGQVWIECDSAHADAAASLFVDQGFSCQIRTDQYQVPRFLVVSFT